MKLPLSFQLRGLRQQIEHLRLDYLDHLTYDKVTIARLSEACTQAPWWAIPRGKWIRHWAHKMKRLEAQHHQLLPDFLRINSDLEKQLAAVEKQIEQAALLKRAQPITRRA